MPHDSFRNVSTFPTAEPKFPAQIDVLTVHEEKTLIEATQFFENFSTHQYGSTCAPRCFTSLRIVDFGMFSGLLPCFAHADLRIRFRMLQQLFKATIF